jgi:hypothetical protein
MSERFWVVGGEFSCMTFREVVGQPKVLGPFDTREEAKEAWKRVSRETSSSATARFGIAAEQIVLPS